MTRLIDRRTVACKECYTTLARLISDDFKRLLINSDDKYEYYFKSCGCTEFKEETIIRIPHEFIEYEVV